MEKQEILEILIQVESLLTSLQKKYDQLTSVQENITICNNKKEHLITIGQRCLWVFLLFCYIIPGIIYSLYLKRNAEKITQECNERLQLLHQRKQELTEEIIAEYDEITATGILNFLPETYIQSNLINKLISYFRLGRADTMKEALNLLEEDCHRNKMENMQRQTLTELQHTNNRITYNNILTAIDALNNVSKK